MACILIAKDLLPAEQVIQFVRIRRPGSIQTSAQQQFVVKFERAMELRMQIFPVLEETVAGPKRSNASKKDTPSLHLKTIKLSVQDQQFFLSPAEVESHRFKYIHKTVFYCSTAMKRLSFEHFILACLAVTGLTRLTIKKNLEMDTDDTNGKFPMLNGLAPTKSARKLLKKKSSFMVATNSLSESGEENILTEVKLELNRNNWTRLFAITDVVAADLLTHPDSFRTNRRESANQSFLQLRKGLSTQDDASVHSTDKHEKVAEKLVLPAITPADRGDNQHHQQVLSKTQSQLSSAALDIVKEESHSSISNNMSSGNPLFASSVDEESDRLKQTSSDGLSPPSSSQHTETPEKKSPPQKGPSRKGDDTSSPPTRSIGPPALSMSRLRANSLRVISDAEIAKSKKMAINLVAQLLLDWLETRQQPLLSSQHVQEIGDIWKSHGHRYFGSGKGSFQSLSARCYLYTVFV